MPKTEKILESQSLVINKIVREYTTLVKKTRGGLKGCFLDWVSSVAVYSTFPVLMSAPRLFLLSTMTRNASRIMMPAISGT